jgi:glutamine---fructose-6-phosphate transaminase (isomerizing)
VQSLRKFPDPFLEEIHRQPDAVRDIADGLARQLDRVSGLPGRGVLLFTGMGASYHACYPAVNELAARGIPALPVDTAELLHFRRPLLSAGALVVAVSQSGESAEVVRLAEEIRAIRPAHRPFMIAVTNGAANRLAVLADAAIDTLVGPEQGPSTMTFAASLVALAGLARVLAGEDSRTAGERTVHTAYEAARAAERLLSGAEERADHLVEWHRAREVTVLLGRGPARAASEMGALVLKEAAGVPAEALEAAQFRHGPLELAGPSMAAMVVATEPETLALDLSLAGDLVESGAAVLVVSPERAPAGALWVEVDRVDRTVAPAVSVIPAQLLAWRLAVERGRTPGVLTRATKVTTRE